MPMQKGDLMRNAFSLIEASDSILIIIDAQEHFLSRLEEQTAQRICLRIRWLAQLAGWMKIPVLVTAEVPRTAKPSAVPNMEAADPGTVPHRSAPAPMAI